MACTSPPPPLDRAFDEPAAELLSDELAERGHARIVAREQLGGPERFRVAPVRAVSFPTRREVRQAGPLPRGVDGLPVRCGFREQVLRVVRLAESSGGVGRAEHAAQVPQVVAHDVVLAVPEILAVGGSRRAARRRRAEEWCAGPAGSTPPRGASRVDPRQELAVAGDLVVLPQGPDGLAVGVELARLRLEPSIGALAVQVAFDRLGGGVRQAGLLQFHDLVGAVADVELVVETFAAVHLAVVVGDQLADVGGQQRLGGLAAGHLDLAQCRRSRAARNPRCVAATGPDLPRRSARRVDREERVASNPFG